MPSIATALLLLATSCNATKLMPILGDSIAQMFRESRKLDNKLEQLAVDDGRLVVTWIGHATVLIQLDDKFVLTDPVFTETVGNISARLVEPGVEVRHLPQIDAVVISHLHMDHLSLGSIDLIEDKVDRIYMPEGGAVYLPRGRVLPRELSRFESDEVDELTVTAVPVKHLGWRYGFDQSWMTVSFTGYVIEYHGLSVYFGGDTAYDRPAFEATAARFGELDLVLMPIAPIEPRDFMCRSHTDPKEALDAFEDLGGRYFVPIHFDTFINSFDEYGVAPRVLREEIARRGYPADRAVILKHGQRHVFEGR